MKRIWLGVALLGAALLGVTVKPWVHRSAVAPDFQLSALNGGLSSLSDYRGKVVLLNFWATWCPGCVEELPALEKAQRAHKDEFLVLGVSLDLKRDDVAAYVKKLGLSFPILMADKRVTADYNVGGLPTSYLIDAEGLVVKRYFGVVDPSRLENDILSLLQRRKR